jgi:hypothetical protein
MMNRFLIRHTFFLTLVILLCSNALADIVILKNGQSIKDVKVKDLGDTLSCESQSRTYYISKKSVESIVRTDRNDIMPHIRRWADDLISSMPPAFQKYIHTYPRLIFAGISLICMMILILAVFKYLWNRILRLGRAWNKRHQLRRDIKWLDEDEKAVLREFVLQEKNSIELPVEDKTVAGLIRKDILEPIGSKGEYSVRGMMLPAMITPSAKKCLKLKMLGMPPVLNDETRKALINSRPKFIAEMAGFYKKLEKKSEIYW